ncbi:MAG: hypothetical protein J6Y48_10920 [Clostridia bacterium]|nr:hypothetical protein [Clostridia bacterium]
MFESICEAIHREMRGMEDKYANGVQLSDADLKVIDTMAHALKNLATYKAMAEGEGYKVRPRYTRYSGYPMEPENYDRRY